MTKYLLRRLLHGIFSVVVVVAVVMILIYSLMDRHQVFAFDTNYTKQYSNAKTVYTYRAWNNYGYVDFYTYANYLSQLVKNGELDAGTRDKVATLGRKAANDSEEVAEYVKKFTEYYESQGYTVTRLDAVMKNKRTVAQGGQAQLFAYRDRPLYKRLLQYFGRVFTVDNIHNAENVEGERGIKFTMRDPLYGGEKFSPAVIGNGTSYKYLLYTDDKFPYIHQNLVTIKLGTSYAVNRGIDVWQTMTQTQGSYVLRKITYPSGVVADGSADLHSARYVEGSREASDLNKQYYVDDYTNVNSVNNGFSRMTYSFIIGIISVLLSYLVGIPIGIWMAQKENKAVDKIGSAYVVFITAVPGLAYIFLVKAIGYKVGLPTTFDLQNGSWLMYVLPIVSLSLRPIASLMRWLRRYMVDQQNSDYVKFARSGGLSESEIFRNHILKNAAIPIIHGIPGSILFSMVGALITERVYVVPGVGGLLIQAINTYDNGVIVGVTMFYAILSIISIILGDILMSVVDPRINFTTKAR
ncbi:MAG: ABC transporter permease [Erysipelotrichaceae bacterium]|nr:ABC transporter permease [Erysipelotrichaceae bacterium]